MSKESDKRAESGQPEGGEDTFAEEVDIGPLHLLHDTDLNQFGIPATWGDLEVIGELPRSAQLHWMGENMGGPAHAYFALRRLLHRRSWKPQDLADALDEPGHKIRRYTRGETGFDVAFLVRTLEALQYRSPMDAYSDGVAIKMLKESDEEIAALEKQLAEVHKKYYGREMREGNAPLKKILPLWAKDQDNLTDSQKGYLKGKVAQTGLEMPLPDQENFPIPMTGFKNQPIPLFGKVAAGRGILQDGVSNVSEPIDFVDAPPACKGPDCYAVFISGDSMEPAMRSGMVAYVAPSLPVRARDFVVVQMPHPENEDGKPQVAVIKEFKSVSEEDDGTKAVRLRQYNPPTDFKQKNVDQIHRVVAVEFV